MTPLEVAISQIGYTEYPPDSNRTKYGEWYGLNGQPWCMIFVQWCFDQAGTPLPYRTASCSGLLDWYQRNQPKCIVSQAKPNDIVIYSFGHTGIVESATANTVTAIEGNTTTSGGSEWNGGEVARKTRSVSTVQAYIRAVEIQDDSDNGGTDMTYEQFCTYMDRWQAENGVIVTRNPYPVPKRTLQYGDIGNDVKWLQWELNDLGYNCGDIDGDFGGKTEGAVKAFQSDNGLDPDGIVGPLTWNALAGK